MCACKELTHEIHLAHYDSAQMHEHKNSFSTKVGSTALDKHACLLSIEIDLWGCSRPWETDKYHVDKHAFCHASDLSC